MTPRKIPGEDVFDEEEEEDEESVFVLWCPFSGVCSLCPLSNRRSPTQCLRKKSAFGGSMFQGKNALIKSLEDLIEIGNKAEERVYTAEKRAEEAETRCKEAEDRLEAFVAATVAAGLKITLDPESGEIDLIALAESKRALKSAQPSALPPVPSHAQPVIHPIGTLRPFAYSSSDLGVDGWVLSLPEKSPLRKLIESLPASHALRMGTLPTISDMMEIDWAALLKEALSKEETTALRKAQWTAHKEEERNGCEASNKPLQAITLHTLVKLVLALDSRSTLLAGLLEEGKDLVDSLEDDANEAIHEANNLLGAAERLDAELSSIRSGLRELKIHRAPDEEALREWMGNVSRACGEDSE